MWEFNEFFSRYGWEDNEKSYTGDKAKYSNDDMNACFEKIKGLADAGAFPENMATIEYFDAKQLFNEGKAAMFGTGQWDCAEFDKNIGEHIGFWWGPKFEDSSYEQNIAMKVPAAPLVVSSAVKDNDKAKEAAKRAISSPLLEVSVAGAKDAIINVTGGPNISLYDANIALETITQEVGDDINTYLGIAINENLDDEIIVTVIATGFEEEKEEVTVQPSVARPLGEEPQTFESYDDDEDDDDGFPPAFIKNRRI